MKEIFEIRIDSSNIRKNDMTSNRFYIESNVDSLLTINDIKNLIFLNFKKVDDVK
ncbi:hypothetical protein LCGC14_0547850 [marine sediment metagenome]|uniref:Uncharacterized protein n=1 Tax=marine sediment metagenome TaxID=412755 RepID=A0A0F9UZ46_9ZZZZ